MKKKLIVIVRYRLFCRGRNLLHWFSNLKDS